MSSSRKPSKTSAAEHYDPAVDIRHIKDHPDNPPERVKDVGELAASIKAKGVLTPVLLARRGAAYLLVAGHRRKHAAVKAGLSTVPAIIRDMTDQEALEALLIENLQRQDLKPSEEARGMKRLEELGIPQRDIGARIGKSQSHVSKRLAILELPASTYPEVDSGRIRLEDVPELAKLRGHPKRIEELVKSGGTNPT